jgi:hypothetical protein
MGFIHMEVVCMEVVCMEVVCMEVSLWKLSIKLICMVVYMEFNLHEAHVWDSNFKLCFKKIPLQILVTNFPLNLLTEICHSNDSA